MSRSFDGVDNVLQFFDAFIGERRGDRPVIVGEGVVADRDAAAFGAHPDRRLRHHVLGFSEDQGGLPERVDGADSGNVRRPFR